MRGQRLRGHGQSPLAATRGQSALAVKANQRSDANKQQEALRGSTDRRGLRSFLGHCGAFEYDSSGGRCVFAHGCASFRRGSQTPIGCRLHDRIAGSQTLRHEARERGIISNVKPFIETLRVTNPVGQCRASSREASLAWGRVTATAKRRKRDQTLRD